MKKQFVYLLSFLFSLTIYSQNIKTCGVDEFNTTKDIEFDNNRTSQDVNEICEISIPNTIINFSNEDPIVLNVFFQLMKDENGNGDANNINENDMLKAIADLNISFNPYQIFFKYNGFNVNMATNSSNDYTVIKTYQSSCSYPSTLDLINYAKDENFFSEESINIFFVDNIFSSSCFSTNITGNKFRKSIFIKPGYLSSSTLQHEMGHIFALRHTDDKRYDANPSLREHVTRDQGSSDYNAITAGDKVADTYAAYAFPPMNSSTCEFNQAANTQVDDLGVPYVNIQTDNFMAKVTFQSCRQEFTNGQATRMRCYFDRILQHYDRHTDVAALYEPYKLIAHEYTTSYFYQPGFDYDFVLCNQSGGWGGYSEPSAYDDISFIYNDNGYLNYSRDANHIEYDEISQIDHTAVRIIQIDNVQPRKCYSTSLKNAISGSVTKFNDNIPNTNVTITPKDSLQINNPNLIQNLDNGLYNIKKQFNDGSIDERTIIKQNN